MNFKLDHLHIRSDEYEKSTQWWINMFDGEDLGTANAAGLVLRRVKIGDMVLSISPKRDNVDIGPNGKDPAWGLYHIGLLVDDMDAAVAGLKAKGAEFFTDIVVINEHLRVSFMYAPDGVEVELLERK